MTGPHAQDGDNRVEQRGWSFLTNHGHVLLALYRDPDLRQRDIADLVGLTEGAVQRLLHDLEREGYIDVERIGRRNHYELHLDCQLRHPLERHHTVGDLLAGSARLEANHWITRGGPTDPRSVKRILEEWIW